MSDVLMSTLFGKRSSGCPTMILQTLLTSPAADQPKRELNTILSNCLEHVYLLTQLNQYLALYRPQYRTWYTGSASSLLDYDMMYYGHIYFHCLPIQS